MGIVTRHDFDWGYQYDLKTVEGWPATLTIRHIDDAGIPVANARVYEADATVGRFPEMPERKARAAALVKAFDQWMTKLGRKPKPVPVELNAHE